jgi:hypothetical protein
MGGSHDFAEQSHMLSSMAQYVGESESKGNFEIAR